LANPEMTRVLHLCRGGHIGGSQRQLLYLVTHLDRRRYEPIVVCREDGGFVSQLREAGVAVHLVPLHSWRSVPACIYRYGDARRLVQLARRHGADLLHCSNLSLSGYLRWAARRLRVPAILHVRAPLAAGDVRKHGCGEVTAVVAISYRIGEDLLAGGVRPEKVNVIYDGVDLGLFRPLGGEPNVLRRDFPDAGGVLVGIVGRIGLFKRQLVFLEAAERIVRRGGAPVTFFLIGEVHSREYHDAASRLIAEGPLNGHVRFAGRREDMPGVLASLDVLVTLSGGSTMIEAMACGTPVVSAGFSRPEQSLIVQNDRTGLLVAEAGPDALAAAVTRLIQDRPLRQRMAQQARRWAEERFCHLDMVAKTDRLYQSVLQAQ